MRLIKLTNPVTMVSSNAAGSTYAEYAAATTYAAGDKKKVSFESNGTTPRFPVVEYESLAGGNVGHYPPDNPTQWAEIGADNKSRMFDAYMNTQTIHTSNLVVVINANGVDSLGLFNIYGTSVTLKLIHATATIKEETFDLRSNLAASGWYNWLYGSYEYTRYQLLWSFPKYAAGATIEITITLRSSEAKCGLVALGNAKYIGSTRNGPRVGIDNYSIIDTDSLGRTFLAQGAYANRANISVWLNNREVDSLQMNLASVRGEAAIFDCNNGPTNYQSFIIYGFFNAFDITIPGPIRSQCDIEVKGLI